MKGTSDLRSLVRVMKAIAAANIREYNPAQKALLEYTRAIELGLQALLQFGVKDIRMKEESVSERSVQSFLLPILDCAASSIIR